MYQLWSGTLGGLFWSVIEPLVLMTIYTVVFSLFLKVKFTTEASPLTFYVYLLCGLLSWQAVSEGLVRSTSLIRGNVNLVKRVVFPLEILPVNLDLADDTQQVVGFALLIPLAWLVGGTVIPAARPAEAESVLALGQELRTQVLGAAGHFV